jgi:hypothetical protein
LTSRQGQGQIKSGADIPSEQQREASRHCAMTATQGDHAADCDRDEQARARPSHADEFRRTALDADFSVLVVIDPSVINRTGRSNAPSI